MFLTLLTLITIFHAANVTTRCLLLLPVSNRTAIMTNKEGGSTTAGKRTTEGPPKGLPDRRTGEKAT